MVTRLLTGEELGGYLAGKASTHAIARIRSQRSIIGLSSGPGFVYPLFQVDVRRERLRPEVTALNRALLLRGDVWSAMEWWLTDGAGLRDPGPT